MPSQEYDNDRLREEAERKLSINNNLDNTEIEGVVHELQVHQIELEMQNDELRATEQALARTRDRYVMLYDFAPVGYCTVDQAGIVIECNLTLCNLLTVDRSRILQFPLARYIHQQDLLLLRRLIQGNIRDVVLRMVNGDQQRFVEIRVAPLESDSEQQFLLSVTDVTQFHNLVNELKTRSAALDSSSEAIVITNRDHTITYINPAFEQITGYKSNDIVGKSASILKSGQHSSEFYRGIRRTIEQFGHWRGELINKRATGETYPAWLSISQINDSKGVVTNYIGICSNITEIRQQQQHALDQVELLDTALDSAHAGRFDLNLKNHKMEWDQRALDIHGLNQLEFDDNDKIWLKSIFPADMLTVESYIYRQLESPHINKIDMVYRIVRANDREVRYLRATGHIQRDRCGEVESIHGLYFDVTDEMKEKKRLVEARDSAVESSREKSNFLATMSHELRTPLNGILGVADLLSGTVMDEEQSHYLELLTSSANNLLNLLNDVLDISQIEEGRISLNRAPFVMSELIHEQIDRKRAEITNQEIKLISLGLDQLPLYFEGDPFRTSQVIAALLDNATRFTKHSTIAVIVDGQHKEGNEWLVTLYIIDTGIGIESNHINRIFEPFYQADSSITREHGGAGLGLSICRRLIWFMGGEIRAHSEPGAGSTFIVSIPLTEVPGEKWGGDLAILKGKRVATIHDHPARHNNYERSLTEWGGEVTKYEIDPYKIQYDNLIQFLYSDNYSAILFHIDTIEPYEIINLIDELRNDQKILTTPILVCSELLDPALPARLHQLGAVVIFDHSDQVALRRAVKFALERNFPE